METKKAVIPVKGMTSVNCAAAIQRDISKLAGVKNANVNFANEKAVIEFDPAAVVGGRICLHHSEVRLAGGHGNSDDVLCGKRGFP